MICVKVSYYSSAFHFPSSLVIGKINNYYLGIVESTNAVTVSRSSVQCIVPVIKSDCREGRVLYAVGSIIIAYSSDNLLLTTGMSGFWSIGMTARIIAPTRVL